jgi:chromosome segregation ATPase
MSVSSKHLATFLFGAAAAFAAGKYMNMSDEEKQKLSAKIKDKAHQLKDEAETSVDKAKDYFNELKTKGSDAFKEHFPDAEKYFHDLFHKDSPDQASATADAKTGDTPGGTT